MDNKIPNIKDRILQIAKFKGISYELFCAKIGMTYSSFKGNAKNAPLNSDAIVNTLSNYPDIDSDWLLTGKGDMLKKKSENFSENKSSPDKPKNQAQKSSPDKLNQAQKSSPKQYDPADGQIYDFAENSSDQEQIDNLNQYINGLQQKIDQKNELLAAKDELLAAKDQTIAMQKEALRLMEGQIKAVTGLVEQLTDYMKNDAKNRPEHSDARDTGFLG